MLNSIQDFVKKILPSRHKQTSSGWISFNSPCCVHNGESLDTRGRGGINAGADGSVSYHCFNCGFKASYKPGRHLTFKFRKLLRWLGVDDTEVKRLAVEALRIKEFVAPEEEKNPDSEVIDFETRELPIGAVSFSELHTFFAISDSESAAESQGLTHRMQYVRQRFIDTSKYEFYLTDQVEHSLHQRVVIPFGWKGRTVGWTARTTVDGVKPKYFSEVQPGYVFNIDNQGVDWKFVIVCEGPFDAMSVDGVAILGSECSEQQAELIEGLAREVIVVPDADTAGNKLISNALEYGWSVSFPLWQKTCKDINEAVIRYGKLFVIKSILDAKESNRVKIELLRKRKHN